MFYRVLHGFMGVFGRTRRSQLDHSPRHCVVLCYLLHLEDQKTIEIALEGLFNKNKINVYCIIPRHPNTF